MNPVGPTLRKLGWDDRWTSLYEQTSECEPLGRVIRAGRLPLVRTERLEVLADCPTGHTPRPICGDWVTLKLYPNAQPGDARGLICTTLPRRNAVVRQAAGAMRPQAIVANVEAIWLVCGLDRDQGIRSLARYQALARLDNVEVTILLNKLDLSEDLASHQAQAQAQAPDLDVIAVSAVSRQGLDQLASKLTRCRTTALIGPSGVGKSALINALVEGARQSTGAVREEDRRGRHTTSTGNIIATPNGALLVDTPGLRELALWEAAGFDNSYTDILDLAQHCRFRDCQHDREPKCQVRLALEQGQLSSERFLAYLELLGERVARAGRDKRQRFNRTSESPPCDRPRGRVRAGRHE